MRGVILLSALSGLASLAAPGAAAGEGAWEYQAGVRGFKHAASGIPNEIGFNPVFHRWERLAQDPAAYEVQEYAPLEPLYFNFSLGVDVLVRYRQRLMLKIGYDYSNPFGIGGSGRIRYRETATGSTVEERKEFSYTSHQVSLFVGPILPMGEGRGDLYMGFSMMPPTWVSYREEFSRAVDGAVDREYKLKLDGFFGSCRALIGAQVPVGERWAAGSEAVVTFLNYMKLTSGNLEDHSFRFPDAKWDFTLRYRL